MALTTVEEILPDCYMIHLHLMVSESDYGTSVFHLSDQPSSYHVQYTYDHLQSVFALQLVVKSSPDLVKCTPSSVNASKDGDKKELIESAKGTWGPVFWIDPLLPEPNTKNIEVRLVLDLTSRLNSGQRTILAHLSKLLDTCQLADVEFLVKGESIGAHAAILSAGSPVMAAIFHSKWSANRHKIGLGGLNVITVTDTEPQTFKMLLRYLYTGLAPDPDPGSSLERLFVAAHKYQVEELRSICEQRLCQRLQLDNVVHHLVVAHCYSAPALMIKALDLVRANKNYVCNSNEWQRLVLTHPDLFFQTVQLMVE